MQTSDPAQLLDIYERLREAFDDTVASRPRAERGR